MKVVLDSNVLLVAIGKKSRFHPIWRAFLLARYQVVLTDEIILEYTEILHEHAAPDAVYKRIYYNWHAITGDADDNKFFDAAVAANADYLVTNDAHFNEAKKLSFPKVSIVSADEFLALLTNKA